MKLDALQIGIFDVIAVGVLLFGLFRGRKRGMSLEMLDLIKWLAILFGAAALYPLITDTILRFAHLNLLIANLISYGIAIGAINILFGFIKRAVGEKIVGADVFGGSEFLLGMIAGMFRYACILVVGMSFIGARYYSPEEIASTKKFQQDAFGNISFPTLMSVQQTVFAESMTGNYTKRYLALQMLKPTSYSGVATPGQKFKERQEKALDETLK
jgi:uncharacterized membrane protein required for colicin V production